MNAFLLEKCESVDAIAQLSRKTEEGCLRVWYVRLLISISTCATYVPLPALTCLAFFFGCSRSSSSGPPDMLSILRFDMFSLNDCQEIVVVGEEWYVCSEVSCSRLL